jgi:hypothetical protein
VGGAEGGGGEQREGEKGGVREGWCDGVREGWCDGMMEGRSGEVIPLWLYPSGYAPLVIPLSHTRLHLPRTTILYPSLRRHALTARSRWLCRRHASRWYQE